MELITLDPEERKRLETIYGAADLRIAITHVAPDGLRVLTGRGDPQTFGSQDEATAWLQALLVTLEQEGMTPELMWGSGAGLSFACTEVLVRNGRPVRRYWGNQGARSR